MEQAAGAFEAVAGTYEATRPGYPAPLLDVLVDRVGSQATVLDLGAGTGKLTRGLVQRFARVMAVEPVPAMRRALMVAVPQATALDDTAEHLTSVREHSVQLVTVAQAWQWFEPQPALAAIRRVLTSTGALAIVRNVPDVQRQPELWAATANTIRPVYPSPSPSSRASAPLQPPPDGWLVAQPRAWRHDQTLSSKQFVDLSLSSSAAAALEPAARDSLRDALREVARQHGDRGDITVSWVATLVMAEPR